MSGTKGRFRPVYVDHKKKIISLREKKWRFEFSQSDLRKFFGKGFHKVSITGVLIVSILVMSTTFPSEAQTTTFFAGTCLGEWETTKNVIGEAQVHDSSPEWFSSNNSALSRGKPVSMYCGDFQGNVPDKGIVGKATLSFSLFVGDEYIDEEMVVHATSTNWAEFVRQKETSVDTYVESGSVNLVNATSGEAMTVAGDGDMFDEGQTATSGDDMSSEEESTTTFSEEELTETVEDEDTEAVTVESNDFMDSFWDILDAPEGAEVSFTLTEEIETGGTATTVIEGIDLEQDLYDIIDAPADSTVEYHIEDVMDSVDQEEPELVVEQEVLPVEEVPVEEPIFEPVIEQETLPEEEIPTEEVETIESAETVLFLQPFWDFFALAEMANAQTIQPETSAQMVEQAAATNLNIDPDAFPSSEFAEDEENTTTIQEEVQQDMSEGQSLPATLEIPTDTIGDQQSITVTPQPAIIPINEESDEITIEGENFEQSIMDIIDAPADKEVNFTLVDPIVTEELHQSLVEDELNFLLEEPILTEGADPLFSVEYTFDSVNWEHVGYVTVQNWEDISFVLPVVSWDDVSDVQIRVTSNDGVEQTIFIDAMSLDVEYYQKKPADIEKMTKKKSFKVGEELSFEFKYKPADRSFVEGVFDTVTSLFGLDREFTVSNVRLVDMYGKHLNVDTSVEYGSDDSWTVLVDTNKRIVKPGKYYIVVEVKAGDEIVQQQQEFYLGVLAINTNKSVYEPNENAHLQIGVLDNMGHTLCDSTLQLVVTDPLGEEVVLSTADSTIIKSGVCAGDSYVEEPDYSAFYRVGDSGVYTMQLTNLDTGHELTDHFEVRSSVAFVVERFGPTRIYPPATYEMKIKITAKQDFDGEIYEYVPDTFEIKDVLQEIISSTASSGVAFIDYRGISPALEEDTTQLLWLSTMNNNDSATITYIFDAPDVSPEFYLLGPMEFYE